VLCFNWAPRRERVLGSGSIAPLISETTSGTISEPVQFIYPSGRAEGSTTKKIPPVSPTWHPHNPSLSMLTCYRSLSLPISRCPSLIYIYIYMHFLSPHSTVRNHFNFTILTATDLSISRYFLVMYLLLISVSIKYVHVWGWFQKLPEWPKARTANSTALYH